MTESNLPRPGTLWRSHKSPTKTCVVLSSSSLRTRAHWTDYPDQPFKTSTGVFLRNFCHVDEICTIKVAAMAQHEAVMHAQKKLGNMFVQFVEKSLSQLPALMETERDKRVSANAIDLLLTDFRDRYSRLIDTPSDQEEPAP